MKYTPKQVYQVVEAVLEQRVIEHDNALKVIRAKMGVESMEPGAREYLLGEERVQRIARVIASDFHQTVLQLENAGLFGDAALDMDLHRQLRGIK